MLRVAVAGALGRMGRVAVTALQAADDIEYVGGFARSRQAEQTIVDDLRELFNQARPDALVDFTTHPASFTIAMDAIAHDVRPVIGSTGWSEPEREALDAAARARGLAAMLVPNFSLGALLMMHFAEEAATFFSSIEIVELHHDRKKDAPSGTSRMTAERIAAAGGPADVPIHSVRMRGLLAHQEVLLGTDGELLTIRHDSLSRDAFAPGILAAARHVMSLPAGLHVGLPLDALRADGSRSGG